MFRKLGPERLSELLSQLMIARGYQGLRASAALENAWSDVAGRSIAGCTRPSRLRGGTLEILVDNPMLLQELEAFRKRELLQRLRSTLPDTPVRELRFRLGAVARHPQPQTSKEAT